MVCVEVSVDSLGGKKTVYCSSREKDVAAIDVNMGCPKEYSTKVRPKLTGDR